MGITRVSYHYTYCCLVLDINYRKKTAPAILPQRAKRPGNYSGLSSQWQCTLDETMIYYHSRNELKIELFFKEIKLHNQRGIQWRTRIYTRNYQRN